MLNLALRVFAVSAVLIFATGAEGRILALPSALRIFALRSALELA